MMHDAKDTVTIPKSEYETLLDASKFLDALRTAGVDNWDGYEIAQDILQEDMGND